MKSPYKTIYIPHLKYTVLIRDMSDLKGDKHGPMGTFRVDEWTSVVFIEDVKNTIQMKENFSMLVHEFMHVMQHLSEHFCMDITTEMEHSAYIMQFLIDETLK